MVILEDNETGKCRRYLGCGMGWDREIKAAFQRKRNLSQSEQCEGFIQAKISITGHPI